MVAGGAPLWVRPRRRIAVPQLSVPLAVAYGTATVTALTCLLFAAREPVPAVWRLIVTASLLLAGRAVRLPLRLGERRVLVVAYSEAAILATLLLLPAPWAPLLVGATTLLGQVPRRLPLWRALFNCSAMLGPAGAMALVFTTTHTLLPGPVGTSLGLLLAAPFLTFLNCAAVTYVVAAAHGEAAWPALREDLRPELVTTVKQALLCASAYLLVVSGQYVALLVIPSAAVLIAQHSSREHSRATQTDALARLNAAGRHVSTLNLDEAAGTILTRAVELFAVDTAAIQIDGTGAVRVWERRHGALTTGRLPLPGSDVGTLVTDLTDTQGNAVGQLHLTFPRPPQLQQAEQQVLNTFAATSGTTLDHCLSYERQAAQVRTDSLTGLANRLSLQEYLGESPAEQTTIVLLIDLDHFKDVNDTLGHAGGDRFLIHVADTLRAALRPGDLAGRIGGDEFAVLLPTPGAAHDPGLAVAIAHRLLAQLNAPFLVDGLELPVEASIGVAVAPGHGTDLDELLRRADTAMYAAKRERNSVRMAHPDDEPAPEGLQLLGQLQAGLRLGEITVFYQPLVDLSTGELLGAEALVRWEHPEHGLVGPDRFIPLVEKTGLIMPLTLEVLDQAVAQARSWTDIAGRPLGISVNLSPRCLLSRGITQQVLDILTVHQLPPRQLTLEITETLAFGDLDLVGDVLASLRDAGIGLAIDDFGTGYSSMSFLRDVPVQEVKIDKSFVFSACESAPHRAIIASTLALSHGLGLTVVAEGVETLAQVRLLQSLACDVGQGYYFGRPEPAAEFRRHLLASPWPLAAGKQSRPYPGGSRRTDSRTSARETHTVQMTADLPRSDYVNPEAQ